MKKISLSIILILTTVLLVSLASASVNEVNNIKYGIIENNGSLTTTTTSITNSNVLGFVCTSDDCSSVSSTLVNKSISSSSTTVTYPTVLENNGYGLFFYKDGYIAYAVKSTYAGTGNAPTATDYLTRKAACSALLSDLVVTNNNGQVTISSNVQSPISKAGPLNLIPSEIANQFQVGVNLDLEITGASNSSQSKTLNLEYSDAAPVSFTSNLGPGNYTITLTSSSSDLKCLSSINQTKTATLNIPSSLITCYSNSDCGTNGPVGNLFCSENNVMQNFISFTCNNPGLPTSTCTNSTSPILNTSCSYSCFNGQCINPIVPPINLSILSPVNNQVFNFNLDPETDPTTSVYPVDLVFNYSGHVDNCSYNIDSSTLQSLDNCTPEINHTIYVTGNGTHVLTLFASNPNETENKSVQFKISANTNINITEVSGTVYIANTDTGVAEANVLATCYTSNGNFTETDTSDSQGHYSVLFNNSACSTGSFIIVEATKGNLEGQNSTIVGEGIIVPGTYGNVQLNLEILNIPLIPNPKFNITIISPKGSLTINQNDSILLNFSATGNITGLTCTYLINNQSISIPNCSSSNLVVIPFSLLINGTNNLTVFGTTPFYSNLDSEQFNLLITEVINPNGITIKIISPADGQEFTSNSSIPLNFVIIGPAISCWFKLDSSSFVPLPGCANSTFSAGNGAHAITVFANNSNGSVFSSTNNFIVNVPQQCTSNCGSSGSNTESSGAKNEEEASKIALEEPSSNNESVVYGTSDYPPVKAAVTNNNHMFTIVLIILLALLVIISLILIIKLIKK